MHCRSAKLRISKMREALARIACTVGVTPIQRTKLKIKRIKGTRYLEARASQQG